jgi:4-amino-4-deoxy-L-arabinose transferase-like glycosyltransferase
MPRPQLERGSGRSPGPGLGLGAVVALWAVLGLYGLGRVGYPNEYYAAAVLSMTESWKAFFFGSIDSVGFITVDKPPFALWVQALSARAFGFNTLSVMLPQAVAGLGTVLVVY